MQQQGPSGSFVAKTLLEPYELNDSLTLKNRIVMAPMTRCMATDELVPTEQMAGYYARRAEAGLIISEATIVRPDGQGYPNTPGIYSSAQVKGWQQVTEAVHAREGLMFLQLWHVGRVSHPSYLKGELPVAPSAVPLTGRLKRNSELEYGMPRALETDEIPAIVEAYAQGAANAMEAGFDGVEIHGANGYLIDQFLHRHSNRRTDGYGGSMENLTRFALEVVDAVVARVDRKRVGIRLSPGAYHYMESHPDDPDVFRLLLAHLEERRIAYVHTGIFDDSIVFDYLDGTATAFLRRHHRGAVIGCGSYTPQRAAECIADSAFDLIAFGRPFIANPDLVSRIAKGEAPAAYDESMLETLR
jgi:2,4-dienoyl-CoA reductase-like NADH-dependent reductase (Old Yellow Enzyme family)